MSPEEFRSVCRRAVEDAVNFSEEELTEHRRKAMQYYMGEPLGNEIEGHSSVVMTEVCDTIEFMMPSLMRAFTTGRYGQFRPQTPADAQGAEQATDYCSHVIERQNPGFLLLHAAFKDALLDKVGVIKSWYETTTDTQEEHFEGIDAATYEVLKSDPEVEVVEATSNEYPPEIDPMTGAPGAPKVSYDCTIRRKTEVGRIRSDNVPPEEFLIERRARSEVKRVGFCAHRTTKTVSELVEMGVDEDVALEQATAKNEDEQGATEKRERHADIAEDPFSEATDDAAREVVYTECYIRCDYDEDGVAELRRAVFIGDNLDEEIVNEPWDYIPFDLGSPILMSHRTIGRSIAELVMDVQMIRSTLLRQMLDNIYRNNNARWAAVEGQVNFDDLLSSVPGGAVRIRQQGAVEPLRPPILVGEAMQVMEFMDQVRENRTGVSKAAAGLAPDQLQSSTLEAVQATLRTAEGKIELIARVLAETLVKGWFKTVLHLVTKHVREPQMVRLRDKWVPMDPRSWRNDYDYDVEVGLGTGKTQERMSALAAILTKQELVLTTAGSDNPLVTPMHYADALQEMTRTMGFLDAGRFFAAPEQVNAYMEQKAAQGPQPDPKTMIEMQKAQAEQQTAQMKAQGELQIAQAKAQSEMQVAQLKAQAEQQLAREKAAAEIALEREKAELQARLQQQELEHKMRLREMELQTERELRLAEIAMQGQTETNVPRATQ